MNNNIHREELVMRQMNLKVNQHGELPFIWSDLIVELVHEAIWQGVRF